MSAREGAARRGHLRKILSTKSQADAAITQAELLQQLGADVSLRTLKRDLRVLRGSVTKGTRMKRAGEVNRSGAGSNTSMTKKIQQIEERLDAIEGAQLRVIGALERSANLIDCSREYIRTLLAITTQAKIEHNALRSKYEEMQETFTAAVSHRGEHTNH